jgi:hypothetical protein
VVEWFDDLIVMRFRAETVITREEIKRFAQSSILNLSSRDAAAEQTLLKSCCVRVAYGGDCNAVGREVRPFGPHPLLALASTNCDGSLDASDDKLRLKSEVLNQAV